MYRHAILWSLISIGMLFPHRVHASTVSVYDIFVVTGAYLTVKSTSAVDGNAFSVGGSTFTVEGGTVSFGGLLLRKGSSGDGSASSQVNLGNLSTTRGVSATVGGGDGNQVTAGYGTVSGGTSNTSAGYAAVSGGLANTAGEYGVVCGGLNNVAARNGVVCSGRNLNTAGEDAGVFGGSMNTASVPAATVVGGSDNEAHGRYSFVAGYGAKTLSVATGSFVWADKSDSTGTFHSFLPREFKVRSKGGFYVDSASSTFLGNMVVGPASSTYATTLDVVGDAMFGTGATKSTFSATGELRVSGTGSSWALGKLGLGTASPNEKATVDGVIALAEQGSSPSTTSAYGKLYTKSSESNLYYQNDSGTEVTLTSGTISKSTWYLLWSDVSTNRDYMGPCIDGSTITLTLGSSRHVDVSYSGFGYLTGTSNGGGFMLEVLVDGGFFQGYDSGTAMAANGTGSSAITGRQYVGAVRRSREKLSSGPHNFCLTFATTTTGDAHLDPTVFGHATNPFMVEIREATYDD